MKNKKNRFLIFFIFNAILIVLILVLSITFYNYKTKVSLQNNNFVKDQVIINPETKSPEILDRSIEIKFVAKVDKLLNWEFKPIQDKINIKIGEKKTIKYKGTNLSNRIITSTANFKIEPEAAQAYLVKTECFCFIEQTLKPGESQIFTMIFYIEPSLDSDWYFDDLKELVFIYEFSEYKS